MQETTRAVVPSVVDDIFGISPTDLLPIVECAVQESPLTLLKLSLEHECLHKGMRSEVLIPTLYYRDASGIYGAVTFFVKRQRDPEAQEETHYHVAAQADIPTPRCYGCFTGTEGEEILVLELLAGHGIDEQNEAEVRALVSLVARINSAPLRCPGLVTTQPLPMAQRVRESQLDIEERLVPELEHIWEGSLRGKAGPDIQELCRENPQGVQELAHYALSLTVRSASLPQDAFIQGDAGSHNMGWRITPEKRELVSFDLEFSIGSRFYDISYIMHHHLGDSALSLEEIAIHYLTEYAHWGGETIGLSTFLDASRWLADSDKLWSLPWLWNTSLKQIRGGDPTLEVNSNDFPAWLHTYLAALLESARQ